MAEFRIFLVCLLCWVSMATVQAQNRYAVHYKYKAQTDFSLTNPQAFLTNPSIERRERQQINLDSLDLPVSEKYITYIEDKVIRFLFHSNWLNASVLVAEPEAIAEISQLDFVEKVVFVAPGFSAPAAFQPETAHRKFNQLAIESNQSTRTMNGPVYTFQNELLGIPAMHEEGFKGKGITIAVFDAGFPGVNTIPSLLHLSTNNQIIGTKDFVEPWNTNVFVKNQHGSNVLSLIASNDPDVLVAGAPEANYILCITEDVPTEYRIEEYNWVKAAEYADSLGVDIINSSLGYWDFDDPSMDYTIADLDGNTSVITKGATIAGNKGILVVTSAGNYGGRGASSITMPSDATGILAIGAVTSNFIRSGFSSQGPTADGRIKPDLTTLGSDVWLMRPNGQIGRGSGTSFSSPQVAALAAGLWQAKPQLTKDELIHYLRQSASQSENPDNEFGYGIPEFRKAFLGEILSVDRELIQRKVYPNPLKGDILFVAFDQHVNARVQIFDMQGRKVWTGAITRQGLREPFAIPVSIQQTGLYMLQIQSGSAIYRTKFIKK
ncbi:S8 family serine peptidase [Mongoliitalea daihaiensis]|uniref:S8 family serine peptidase n=1 Tax=Mongoliitalea daihaiensis TaxID=2782006 RepID=UPI001F1C6C25|nr:S8 family serine peptidase [Mongoliitalea daihaiensis]UJP64304.1 S8 family serine peptidase [Mongoliitalea daihaiensis]